METLLQHLFLVSDISCDRLEGQAEVQSSFLNVTANPVQLCVSKLILGVLLQETICVTEIQCQENNNCTKQCNDIKGFDVANIKPRLESNILQFVDVENVLEK